MRTTEPTDEDARIWAGRIYKIGEACPPVGTAGEAQFIARGMRAVANAYFRAAEREADLMLGLCLFGHVLHHTELIVLGMRNRPDRSE